MQDTEMSWKDAWVGTSIWVGASRECSFTWLSLSWLISTWLTRIQKGDD